MKLMGTREMCFKVCDTLESGVVMRQSRPFSSSRAQAYRDRAPKTRSRAWNCSLRLSAIWELAVGGTDPVPRHSLYMKPKRPLLFRTICKHLTHSLPIHFRLTKSLYVPSNVLGYALWMSNLRILREGRSSVYV